jgi:triphosphoribosyl-dephospho-CoA synthase
MIPIGMCAQLACIWEATARKPGNVHRFRDFDDTTYLDFLQSAAAIAPILETASQRRVGETILQCVQASQAVTLRNTNLGIILLLAPLAAVPYSQNLRTGLKQVLANLDVTDSRAAYEAIRLARPGGLGQVSEQDISREPTLPLRDLMAMAADRDMVARQYVTFYSEVLNDGVPAFLQAFDQHPARGAHATPLALEEAIICCHLHLMARYPDSLIARKTCAAEAEEASRRAGEALDRFWTDDKTRWEELSKLDAWLRAKGNTRNPGTTADLVTACLFIALREGSITLPLTIPFSAGQEYG